MNSAVPWLPELFGGRQSARTVHFISASLIVLFVIIHVAKCSSPACQRNALDDHRLVRGEPLKGPIRTGAIHDNLITRRATLLGIGGSGLVLSGCGEDFAGSRVSAECWNRWRIEPGGQRLVRRRVAAGARISTLDITKTSKPTAQRARRRQSISN
jgi:hypothetical protein